MSLLFAAITGKNEVGMVVGTGIEAVAGNPTVKSPGIVVGVEYPDGLVGVTVTTAYELGVAGLIHPTPVPNADSHL